MQNLRAAALPFLAITLLQLTSLEPSKGPFAMNVSYSRGSDEKVQACMEACRAFIDQPGWELRACVAKCQSQGPASL